MAAFDAGFRPAAGSGKNPNDSQDRGWAWSLPDDLRAQLARPTILPTWTDAPGEHENLPINYLEWTSAFAFCTWDGGRLPTKEEWQHAATGGESRYYPWSSPPNDQTIDAMHATYECRVGCTIEGISTVGAKPAGNGRFGQADLAGNVWEWLRDLRSGSGPMAYGDACGGGFQDIASAVRPTSCTTPPPNAMKGARCARAAN